MPDLGTAPAVTALGAGASLLGSQVALAMNGALSTRLAGEPGVSLFDFFGLERDIVARPAAYGLLNVRDACGASPSCNPLDYLFWDGIHPTSAGAVPEPPSWALWIAGMAALGLRLRRCAITTTL